jgi:SAM-dependent methyltransferase
MKASLFRRSVLAQAKRWRQERFQLFLSLLHESSSPVGAILDLGGGNGAYLAGYAHLLPGIEIIVADIDEAALSEAHTRYGFRTVRLPEQGPLPFADREWDVIFCNSVIEHVTVLKEGAWDIVGDSAFRGIARKHQARFAAEIMRTARSYFVQTPHRGFPIESHTWLPFAQYLPRKMLIRLLRSTNRWWPKSTTPDWYLMNRMEMGKLFPDAEVITERVAGMPKSLVAVRAL